MSETIVTNIAAQILAVMLPVLVAGLVELVRRKIGVEGVKKIDQELATKKEMASLAIRMAEQMGGQDKFNQAASWLSARAEESGFKVTPDEVKGLIEAAVRMAKDEFGEQWANIVAEPSHEES